MNIEECFCNCHYVPNIFTIYCGKNIKGAYKDNNIMEEHKKTCDKFLKEMFDRR
jgi:hypothetical protein